MGLTSSQITVSKVPSSYAAFKRRAFKPRRSENRSKGICCYEGFALRQLYFGSYFRMRLAFSMENSESLGPKVPR